MKYESNILKRLIDTYGVIGNPRYLSEIIKEFIVRGKELFPHLFTYQADWLAHIDEFGLTSDYVVSYTGQQIYTPHSKEKPVKRAILKGSTKYRDIDTGEFLETFEEGRNLELVSVKMPVLKTTGKNLLDVNGLKQENAYIDNTDGNIKSSNGHIAFLDYIAIPNNGNILFFNNSAYSGVYLKLAFYDINKTYISGVTLNTGDIKASIPSNAKYCRVSAFNHANGFDLQLEVGDVKTSYEPFKSNILTVNEDVELGSVGEVKDELNLLTGQLTQRTETRAYQEGDESNSEVITDMANTRYKLPKESIKTVDLSIVDHDNQSINKLSTFEGGTHFTTSSQDGSLLPSLTVDVVTDLEETLMVCSLEGNTM